MCELGGADSLEHSRTTQLSSWVDGCVVNRMMSQAAPVLSGPMGALLGCRTEKILYVILNLVNQMAFLDALVFLKCSLM